MSDQYRMSDVFKLPVEPRETFDDYSCMSVDGLVLIEDQARSAAHAINRHDDLADKVKQQQAWIAELESESLGFDDVLKLTECLSFLGCSTPESKEEAAAKWKTLVRDLIRAVKRSEIMFRETKWNTHHVPEGYVLVPVEPTETIRDAAFEAHCGDYEEWDEYYDCVHKAIIKAAKEPQS